MSDPNPDHEMADQAPEKPGQVENNEADTASPGAPPADARPPPRGKFAGVMEVVRREGVFFLRSAAAFSVAMPCIASLLLNMMAQSMHKWAASEQPRVPPPSRLVSTEEALAGSPAWIDLSPTAGQAYCVSTHISYCRETSDSFEVTGYMHVALFSCLLLLATVFTWELARYGLYGGSHAFTRLVTVLLVFVLGAQVVAGFGFIMTFAFNHCGDPSYSDNDAAMGWPFYIRIVEILLSIGFIVYSLSIFEKTSRGPPSLPLFAAVMLGVISTATGFARSWMWYKGNGKDEAWYSNYAYCQSEALPSGVPALCSTATHLLRASYAGGWLAIVTGALTVFFMSLRAVDAHGTTLRYASATSLLTLLFNAAQVGTFGAAMSSCDGAPTFQKQWPYRVALAATALQAAFFCLNTIFVVPVFWTDEAKEAIGEDGIPIDDYDPDNWQGKEPTMRTKAIFEHVWWDHLKDARTLAHEAREAEELREMLEDEEEKADDEAAALAEAEAAAEAEKLAAQKNKAVDSEQ